MAKPAQSPSPGPRPLCSTPLCHGAAVQLEPVHLCAACLGKVGPARGG